MNITATDKGILVPANLIIDFVDGEVDEEDWPERSEWVDRFQYVCAQRGSQCRWATEYKQIIKGVDSGKYYSVMTHSPLTEHQECDLIDSWNIDQDGMVEAIEVVPVTKTIVEYKPVK